jgi:hypothetical protein
MTFYRIKNDFYEKKNPSLCRLPWVVMGVQMKNFVCPLFERPVNNHRKLDFYESYQIHRENPDHFMNQDQRPLKSPLFDVILKNNAT